jgi:hypothetical protein
MIYTEFFRHRIGKAINILLFIVVICVTTSCLKSYMPLIETIDADKLVVSGIVSDRAGNQVVTISMASTINKPKIIPVSGCTVTIFDDKGHQFPMADSSNGNYYGWIDPQYLIPESSFKVEILTPDENKIVSDFDSYSTSPEIDSIYFVRRDHLTNDVGRPEKGIQFSIDLNGTNSTSKYCRFEVIETWEYHSEYPITWYFSGGEHYLYSPDYSLNVCWSTRILSNIYLFSAQNFAGNKYKSLPLNYVNNRTQRLVYGYSLLVHQYSLSEAAFKYWNQMSVNSTNQGGLYSKQPMATKGNLRNLTHPDQEVLGFFGASSVKSKRIFVKQVENLELETESTCAKRPVTWAQLIGTDANSWPLYLLADAEGNPRILLEEGCVDCRDLHGTLVKPDFWPY